MIAVISYVNIRGIKTVGKIATVLETLIFLPVAAMCVMSVRMWHHNPVRAVNPAASARVPGFRRRTGIGIVAVLRV